MVQTVWEDFLKIAKEEAGSRVVETWFKAVSFQNFNPAEDVVYLQAPNQFVKNWIKSNYMSLLQTHLGRLLHVQELKIAFVDDLALAAPTEEQVFTPSVEPFQMVPAQLAGERRGALAPLKTMSRQVLGNINPAYTFDSFVVGPSNSLAYAAAHAITEKPGRLYNPLFVYGGSGLGKTHLLHAIGNAIKDNQQQAHVLYQTADRFVNEFISAIRFNKVHKFQEKYRDIDVLLIDDFCIAPLTDENRRDLLEVFDDRYEKKSTIVTSQLPIKEWHKAIGENTLADAILDRLIHHSQRFALEGESKRKSKEKE